MAPRVDPLIAAAGSIPTTSPTASTSDAHKSGAEEEEDQLPLERRSGIDDDGEEEDEHAQENQEEEQEEKLKHWWSRQRFRRQEHEEQEREPTVNHRYLPILSGLVCPFSVLLDIPGLTERWYVKTDGYTVIETQPNPIILDVGQAVSMALGVIANLGLIMRFLERRPYAGTWVAIVALTVHDIINVVIVTTFGVVHRIDDGFSYGDAYWLTVASTLASLVCNVTLVIDLVRTKDFKRYGSGLTEKQRSLVIAVMSLLCYIGLGSLCFSFLISDLTFISSLYFTICTITSVGFGDILPTSVGSRIFSFFYDVAGLVLLAFTIAIARETIIETFEASYRARRDVLAKRAKERKEEKRRKARERRERREKELRERVERGEGVVAGVGLAGDGDGEGEKGGIEEVAKEDASVFLPARGRGGAGASATITSASAPSVNTTAAARAVGAAQRELDYAEEKAAGVGTVRALFRRGLRRLGWLESWTPRERQKREDEESGVGGGAEEAGGGAPLGRSLTSSSSATGMASIVSEEKFKTFRKQLQSEQQAEFRLKFGIALSLFFLFWTIGALVFHYTEKWSYFDSLWFCFVFFTTIGYGDFAPKSSAGRSFFVAWALFGIANMTLTLSVITETWSSRYKSSIISGKARRTIRRAARSNRGGGGEGGDSTALRLLALEGFTQQEAGEIEAHELPGKLMDAVKGFHEHARYFMLGRTGDPPQQYRNLVDAASGFDDEFAKLVEAGDAGLAEAGGGAGETQHFLFMVSYERQFDTLLDAAEQLSTVFQQHAEELSKMKKLNEALREALEERDRQKASPDEGEEEQEEEAPARKLLPFLKRPPGGFGDERVEKEVEEEVDDDGDVEDGAVSPVEEEQRQAPTTTESQPTSDACRTLDASTTLLNQLDTTTRPRAASSSSPSPPATPVSPPTPRQGISRTPTLSFAAEPEQTRVRERTPSGVKGGVSGLFARKAGRREAEE